MSDSRQDLIIGAIDQEQSVSALRNIQRAVRDRLEIVSKRSARALQRGDVIDIDDRGTIERHTVIKVNPKTILTSMNGRKYKVAKELVLGLSETQEGADQVKESRIPKEDWKYMTKNEKHWLRGNEDSPFASWPPVPQAEWDAMSHDDKIDRRDELDFEARVS